MYGIAVHGPGLLHCRIVEILHKGQNYLLINIDKRGYRSQLLIHLKTIIDKQQICRLFYPLSLYCQKMAKNGHVQEKVGRSDATPTNFFLLFNSYDLKSMSFKFRNDIFITLEIPRSFYSRPVDKTHCNSVQVKDSLRK